MITEKQVESRLKKGVEKLNGTYYKFVSPGRVGVPDRICTFPGGWVIFVEVKKPNGVLSSKQKREIKRLLDQDQLVFTVHDYDSVDALLLAIKDTIFVPVIEPKLDLGTPDNPFVKGGMIDEDTNH